MDDIIDSFSEKAKRYLASIKSRRVFPSGEDLDNLKFFNVPLQDNSIEPLEVFNELDRFGSPATVASTGKRYFGFVVGGAAPAPLAANLLAGVWDQNAGIEVASPVASYLETVCCRWLIQLLNLPPETAVGFVTGATMANFMGLAAARHALLEYAGWDVENEGLFNAPELRVIVGDEVHVSVLKALGLLGLGKARVTRVPVDNQGRMKVSCIPRYSQPTIICAQAGNVNTGAFDPISDICDAAAASGAWVHVDGAFGLWAAASGKYQNLVHGLEKADSWATDAHKWLNVPYDSGIVFVRNKSHLVASTSTSAAYLISGKKREPMYFVPEMSRRARGFEIWAALRSMGKKGIVDLIESNCNCADLFARRLSADGYRILNEVVLNQVLVSFGKPDVTRRIIKRVQAEGTCWCGGTVWQENTAMRISVSSWQTSLDDIERSLKVILRIADEENGKTD